MFLKQYNFKPRSNSQSSGTTDSNSAAQAASPTDAVNSGMQARRRSSATEKFAGLQGMKRNTNDASTDQKKASFAEQKVGSTGILGGMWQNFTKGSS